MKIHQEEMRAMQMLLFDAEAKISCCLLSCTITTTFALGFLV